MTAKLVNSPRITVFVSAVSVPAVRAQAGENMKGQRGQSTIEYLLMVVVGALFSIQIVRFFNDVFIEGLTGLESNISVEMRSGDGFGGSSGAGDLGGGG